MDGNPQARLRARLGAGSRIPTLVALALASLALALSAPSAAQAITLPAGFEETTLVSGLNQPTAVEWAPDGRLFVVDGQAVKVLKPGSSALSTVFQVPGAPYDIAVDSQFASHPFLYVLFSARSGSGVIRLKLSPDSAVLEQKKILGTMSVATCPAPSNDVDCFEDNGSHDVGNLLSAPDGSLYVGNGDQQSAVAYSAGAFDTYNEQSYAGKILRVDRDGRGLPGHPFCAADSNLSHVCTKVWAKGLRNPWRFTLRPNGTLVAGDVGYELREEIDVIRPGKNYGWPCYEGDIRTPTYRDTERCALEYAKEGTSEAAQGPVYAYVRPRSGGSITMGPTYPGGSYPAEFAGEIFFGDYVAGFLKRIRLDDQDRLVSVKDFATGWGAGVDLKLQPGSNDLVSVDIAAGAVKRIRHVAAANRAPVAVASADRTSGPAPLSVAFKGSGSYDPDGGSLAFAWDFDGNGTTDSTQADPTHSYPDGSQNFTAKLTVRDAGNLSASQTIVISPGNAAPTLSLSAPGSFRAGQQLDLSASAADPEDGALAASALTWKVALVHNQHDHPVESPSGAASMSFSAASDHDADSFYRVTVEATDSRGAQSEQTVLIRPETSTLSLQSDPPGVLVSWGGAELLTPYSQPSTIGFRNGLAAPERVTKDGRSFVFDSWSDGGARLHEVTIPETDLTLVARYREERGNRPAQPGPGTPASPVPQPGPPKTDPGTPPASYRFPLARLTSAPARVSRTGRAALRAFCPASKLNRCAGEVRIALVRSGSARSTTAGRAVYSIRAGRTSTISVKLTRTAQKLLARSGRMKVRVTVTAKARGLRATSRSRTVTLVASRR